MNAADNCVDIPQNAESPENTGQTFNEDGTAPIDSSNGDTATNEACVESLIANIFGDTSDNEDGPETANAVDLVVPTLDEGPKFEFDRIQELRKRERTKRRRQNKSEDIGVGSYIDDGIDRIVELMRKAAADDRESNVQRRPAIEKVKLLPVVKRVLLRVDYYEAFIENDMMSAISEWLTPLPDRSLPAFDVRTTMLNIVSRWTTMESPVLKQSGLGKTVMMLSNHPKECQRNRGIASMLVRAWSKPIFHSADYGERIGQCHMPGRKRRQQGSVVTESGLAPPKTEKTGAGSSAVHREPSHSDFFRFFNIKREPVS